ncbi:hypothetical protein ACFWPV_05550 [Streptomyces uncialis]|uniref:hypothetical protein n=1 Tax=Streptomyces uncialis TaxID=1048205 RepID=UPI00365FBC34
MAESVPVRCPVCRRDHQFTATAYPCPCGEPVAPPLDPGGAPEEVTDRAWSADWVTVPCRACARADDWPRPELGCPCGAVLRIPLRGPGQGAPPVAAPSVRPAHIPLPATAPTPRPAFRPMAIRTARDAVTATALYLRWLGFREIRRATWPVPSGVGLAAEGLFAVVEPTVRVTSVRDVECLWLTALSESVSCVYVTLAGYGDGARERADSLGVPLFVVDLAGVPQPANGAGEELMVGGA